MGAWTQNEAGREYLLQQLSATDHGRAREYFAGVVEKPALWDLGKDLRERSPVSGPVFKTRS
ncbi:hypothetical protein THH46_03645 [Pseudomonas sp. NA13]